jgi:hypothetical protein
VKEILLPLSHLMRICFLPTIVLQQIWNAVPVLKRMQ